MRSPWVQIPKKQIQTPNAFYVANIHVSASVNFCRQNDIHSSNYHSAWNTSLSHENFRGSIPTKIFAPPEHNSHHFRTDPKREGRGDGPGVPTYYREIIHAIKDATEILIIGHGHGKASSMLHFIQYLERKEPDLAANIVVAIDTNLVAISEPEILAMARNWFESHVSV